MNLETYFIRKAQQDELADFGHKLGDMRDTNITHFWEEETILLCIRCIALLLVFSTFLFFYLSYRHRKRMLKKEQEEREMGERFDSFLASYVTQNEYQELINEFELKSEEDLSLEPEDLRRPERRHIFKQHLMEWARQLKGAELKKLKELYLMMGFKHSGMADLNSGDAIRMESAIQELSCMDVLESYDEIFSLINHSHLNVRNAAIAARASLDETPICFIPLLQYNFTLWQQSSVFFELKSNQQNLPSFQPLLHLGEDAEWFGLKMISHFRQEESANKVLEFLDHPNDKLRMEAIRCIGILEYRDAKPRLVYLLEKTTNCSETVVLIEALEHFCKSEDAFLFENMLDHDNREVVISAARALVKLQEEAVLKSRVKESDDVHSRWIKHVLEPLNKL